MANCTDCGHASSLHTGTVKGRGPGLIGAACAGPCADDATGKCKGFALADTNCDEAECGHAINDHLGLGGQCLACVALAKTGSAACSGGNW